MMASRLYVLGEESCPRLCRMQQLWIRILLFEDLSRWRIHLISAFAIAAKRSPWNTNIAI